MPDADDRSDSSDESINFDIPRCICSWKNCRGWQKVFYDNDHIVFNGVTSIEWNDDDDEMGEMELLRTMWGKLLKVEKARRSDERFVVAKHHFTEALILDALDNESSWDWTSKVTKREAEDYYGSIPMAKSAAPGDGDLYFKVPNMPKDRVKAMIKQIRTTNKDNDESFAISPSGSKDKSRGKNGTVNGPPLTESSSIQNGSSMDDDPRRPGGHSGGRGISPKRSLSPPRKNLSLTPPARPGTGGPASLSPPRTNRSLSPPPRPGVGGPASLAPPRSGGASSLAPPRSGGVTFGADVPMNNGNGMATSLAPPRRPDTIGPGVQVDGSEPHPESIMNRPGRRVTTGLVTMSAQAVKHDKEKQERIKQIQEEEKQNPSAPSGRSRYGDDDAGPVAPVRPAAMRGAVPLNENRVKRRETRGLNVMNTLSVKDDENKQAKIRQIEEEQQQQQQPPPLHRANSSRFGEVDDNAPTATLVPPPLVTSGRHASQYVPPGAYPTIEQEEVDLLLEERDELQAENEEHEETIDSLKDQIRALKLECARRVEKEEKRNDELEEMAERLEQTELEKQQLQDTMESALAAERASSKKLREQLKKLQKEFSLDKQASFEKTRDLEDEVEQLKKDKERLTNKALQLSGKNAGSMLKIQELEDHIERLEYGNKDRESTLRHVMEKEKSLKNLLEQERERQAMVTAHMYFAKRTLKKMTAEQEGTQLKNHNLRPSIVRTSQVAKGNWEKLYDAIGGGGSDRDLDGAGKALIADTLPEETELERKMA